MGKVCCVWAFELIRSIIYWVQDNVSGGIEMRKAPLYKCKEALSLYNVLWTIVCPTSLALDGSYAGKGLALDGLEHGTATGRYV